MASQSELTKVCPYVRPVAVQGGTFYSFSSASEDFTLSFNENSATKFKFSKFALLDIPDIANEPYSNTLKLDAIAGAYNKLTNNNINLDFSQSFQNYCLNMETMLISQPNYNHADPSTVSERVFFKWLKEMGGLRFVNSSDQPSWPTPLYKEEAEDSSKYSRVVKYLGEIDFINNYSGLTNTYSEIMAHIPTEAGDFKDVYFKSREDDNYSTGMTLCRNDSVASNNFYIAGRTYADSHPIGGFDIRAFYDNPSGLGQEEQAVSSGVQQWKKLPGSPAETNLLAEYEVDKWWHLATSDKHCYHTQPRNTSGITNEDLLIGDSRYISGDSVPLQWTKFRRSQLEALEIEWNPNAYTHIGDETTWLIDVARSRDAQDFSFNAVLFYYDLYSGSNSETEEGDGFAVDGDGSIIDTATNNTEILATNLFGVLFLDNVEPSSIGGGSIPGFQKCIPNRETKLNGNAYGIKLNIKLDASANNSFVNVETVISDSNTLSMDIYADSLNEIRKVSDSIYDNALAQMNLDGRLRQVEDVNNVNTQNSYSVLKDRLTQVESYMTDQKLFLNLAERTDMVDMIRANYDILNGILRNDSNLNVAFDLDGLRAGSGIGLERGENFVKMSQKNPGFNFGDNYMINPPSDSRKSDEWIERNRNNQDENFYEYTHKLTALNNYLKVTNDNARFTPSGDFYLYIEDSAVNWSNGQTMRINFSGVYNMGNKFKLMIKTDFNNIQLAKKNYSTTIATVTGNEFSERRNKPIIEIHCVDAENFVFTVDLIN